MSYIYLYVSNDTEIESAIFNSQTPDTAARGTERQRVIYFLPISDIGKELICASSTIYIAIYMEERSADRKIVIYCRFAISSGDTHQL